MYKTLKHMRDIGELNLHQCLTKIESGVSLDEEEELLDQMEYWQNYVNSYNLVIKTMMYE